MEVDRWDVPERMRRRMVRAARELRKNPTPSERILWAALKERQLDGVRFRRQQAFGPFVADFYAPNERLVVEVDGAVHASQIDRDRERQEILESLGVRFIRVTADELEHDLPGVLAKIRVMIRSGQHS